MANRQQNRGGGGGDNVRQNEYFVPRDGIDREVITADICRYLGNDALVRPGNYHNEAQNRTIQGYYIKAYRNLTTAMIADLKADSARWEQERRKLQSGAGRYADSQVRQMSGGSYGQHGVHQSSSRHDYGGADPRYPGSDAPGYSGSGTPAAAAANYPGYGNATPFSGPQYQGAYPPQAGDVRYATGAGTGPTMKLPYGATPDGWVSGGDLPTTQPQHPAQAPRQDYGMDTPMGDAQPMPTAWTQQYGAPGARQVYASQTQAGYGYATPAAAYQPQVPGAGPAYQQSTDPYYGRGPFSGATPTTQPYSDTIASPAVNPGYSPAPDQTQYDEPMGAQAHPAAAVAGAPAQLPQVPNPGRRERDRGGERERDSHDRQRDRERDRDRGDRDRDRDHRPERGEDGQRRKAHHYGRS